MSKRWKVTASRNIYSDPWIRVRIDDIVRPNGAPGTYSVVELKGGVGIVPVTEGGTIYLVGQYRYAPHVYSWEIPKGAFPDFEHSELPLETAKRELLEETGLTALRWSELAVVHTLLGSTNDKVYLFVATGLSVGMPAPGETEDIESCKVTLAEFHKLIEDGTITDATTIAAVLLTQARYPSLLRSVSI